MIPAILCIVIPGLLIWLLGFCIRHFALELISEDFNIDEVNGLGKALQFGGLLYIIGAFVCMIMVP